MQKALPFTHRIPVSWSAFALKFAMITAGTVVAAIAVIVFFAPSNIAPAGLTGVAVILNDLFGTPIGLMTFVGNIPILYAAYRMLGGWPAVVWMTYISVLFSVAIDALMPYFPPEGISDSIMLNALFAGVVGGFGAGLIYRAGATFGGTSTIARIIQRKLGVPMSSTYLYTNIIVVGLAGVFLGWESALLSLVALMLEGITSDYVMEGPSVIRTATVITNQPQEVADAVLYGMRRGVTGWSATGMYTGQERHILFITIPRSQVNDLRSIVLTADPSAFVVINQGHVAYGADFKRGVPKSSS